MKQVTKKIAERLHAAGFLPEYKLQNDLFGNLVFAGPFDDKPLPSWVEAAVWLEKEQQLMITRVFPDRYKFGQWVALRIIYKKTGATTILPRVPADIEEAKRTAIEYLLHE